MSTRLDRRDFLLRDMDCVTCAVRLEKGLRDIAGVRNVDVSLLSGKTIVDYDAEQVDGRHLEQNTERLGHRPRYRKHDGLGTKLVSLLTRSRGRREGPFREVPPLKFQDLVLRSLRRAVVWITSADCPSCRVQEPSLVQAYTSTG